jgi:hypothetical protein
MRRSKLPPSRKGPFSLPEKNRAERAGIGAEAGPMVIIPCFRPRATSHQLMGYATTNPRVRPMDMTNQKAARQPRHDDS